MTTYAMISQNIVIEVLYNQETKPHWPPTRDKTPVYAIPCDDTVERGMVYDPETGAFGWSADVPSYEEEEVEAEPTQLDRIESALALLTADTVTAESIDTAILEGVNEV